MVLEERARVLEEKYWPNVVSRKFQLCLFRSFQIRELVLRNYLAVDKRLIFDIRDSATTGYASGYLINLYNLTNRKSLTPCSFASKSAADGSFRFDSLTKIHCHGFFFSLHLELTVTVSDSCQTRSRREFSQSSFIMQGITSNFDHFVAFRQLAVDRQRKIRRQRSIKFPRWSSRGT